MKFLNFKSASINLSLIFCLGRVKTWKRCYVRASCFCEVAYQDRESISQEISFLWIFYCLGEERFQNTFYETSRFNFEVFIYKIVFDCKRSSPIESTSLIEYALIFTLYTKRQSCLSDFKRELGVKSLSIRILVTSERTFSVSSSLNHFIFGWYVSILKRPYAFFWIKCSAIEIRVSFGRS